MKKLSMLFFVVLVAALAMSSCNRRHTCVCTYEDPVTNQTVKVEYEIRGKRKMAASVDCVAYEANYWFLDTYVYCELK
jgi:hypothetical protein